MILASLTLLVKTMMFATMALEPLSEWGQWYAGWVGLGLGCILFIVNRWQYDR
jgi:hypothetical protein